MVDLASNGAYLTGRRPQLDALRCFAVLLVVWQHSGPSSGLRNFGLHGFGVYGVWLFFVLSAFLITGVLLRERDRQETNGIVLRTFYARRILRIVPAYVVLLVLAVALGAPMLPGELRAHVLYLSNWFMASRNEWAPSLSHLWSLSIEEQFYLIWPVMVLLVPLRRLPVVLLSVGLGAIAYRIAAVNFPGASDVRIVVPTFANLDSLAAGALLAWHLHIAPHAVETRQRVAAYAFVTGGALLVVVAVGSMLLQARLVGVVEALAGTLIAVRFVEAAATGVSGAIGRVLLCPPILYLGSISYGVYLYHELVIWVIKIVHDAADAPSVWNTSGTLPYQLTVVMLSVLSAAVSARYVERPLMELKRFVSYKPRGELPDTANVAA